tara:strand:+ start:103 stop:441 length:339 start_codon:yes stop_codon:yes gene_type:complete
MCKKCNIEKPITEYRLYRRATGDKDSRDSKCKTCSSYQTEIAKALRKVAPEYKGFCECCSKEYTNPVLDHCHDTESFRGWLCPPCNLGIGILGDRLKDVRNALMYLERTNEK